MKIIGVKIFMVVFSVELFFSFLKNVWINFFEDYDICIWNLFLFSILENVINCILNVIFYSLILEI